MAALRIRKTFRYPEDSDDDGREELDEEGRTVWSFLSRFLEL